MADGLSFIAKDSRVVFKRLVCKELNIGNNNLGMRLYNNTDMFSDYPCNALKTCIIQVYPKYTYKISRLGEL